ncbi:hypothetical protein ANRL4_04339 [Anaerolineae bacterium]|nr:hypothetical protein ANRL4_04339 [Anaerolineae bacterium]
MAQSQLKRAGEVSPMAWRQLDQAGEISPMAWHQLDEAGEVSPMAWRQLEGLGEVSPLRTPFHNLDLVVGQPIQLVHQRVDLPVRRVDLALNQCLVMGGFGGGQTRVQLQHGIH